MATISLEQQKQFGRELGRIQRANETPDPAEEAADAGRIKSAGLVAFVMLGGFALLKDVFDLVFIGMLFHKSGVSSAAEIGDMIGNLGAISAIPHPATVIIGRIAAAIGYASIPLSWAGAVIDAKTQFEGVVMPFLFTNMFMIAVIITLLLSGMGLKSYKIFLSSRFIFVSFVATIVEMTLVLNIFFWTTLYVIYLYFEVRHLKKKEQEKIQTA